VRITLAGDTEPIREGVSLLAADLGLETGGAAYPVHAIRRPGGLEVCVTPEKTEILYEKPCHFYRGLMLLAKHIKFHGAGAVHLAETPCIRRAGLMLDVSRNAVPTIESVKHFLRKMSLMGMDLLMLYMEDTYRLKGYDHFGYMRGRYSEKDLKELDDYAFALGIEIMPYIQTLAHMGQILKWDDAEDIRDTAEIILAGEEKTYRFLDEMIRTVSSPFRSKRINIGMDEAHDLGLGKYLALHGYRNPMAIMEEHLARVLHITGKYGLVAMIASDMLFHNDGSAADHYEISENAGCTINLPEKLDLMYWDYFHTDVDEIREFIRRHKAWGKTPAYLGTVRTWESFAGGYSQSFANTKAAIEACAAEGVEEAIVSVWLNDGAENSLFAALPGMSYFAQRIYNPQTDGQELRECFAAQTNADYDAFLLTGELDEIRMTGGRLAGGNPSKFLLWQDPLLGFFDYHIKGKGAKAHYEGLWKRLAEAVPKMGAYGGLMETMSKLGKVLAGKAEIGIEIKRAYDAGDKAGLRNIAEQSLPAIAHDVEALRLAHRKWWMSTLKPFGWEILDARYGGLFTRLNSAAQRIYDYLNGEAAELPELAEERLPYKTAGESLPTVLCYDRIVSSGYQNGPSK
jgi:hypothetical protein